MPTLPLMMEGESRSPSGQQQHQQQKNAAADKNSNSTTGDSAPTPRERRQRKRGNNPLEYTKFMEDFWYFFILAAFGATVLRICNMIFDYLFAFFEDTTVDDWIILIVLCLLLGWYLHWKGRLEK